MPSTRRLRVVVHRLVLQRLGSPVDPANPVERGVHSVDLVLGLRPSGSGELIALGLQLVGRVVDRRLPDARPIAEMLGLFWASGPSAPPRPFCVLGCAPALPYVEPASSPLQPSMFLRAHRVADTRTEVFEEHVAPFRHLGQGPRRRPAIGGRRFATASPIRGDEDGVVPLRLWPPLWRMSPLALDSTLATSAPRSASMADGSGQDITRVRSSSRMPRSGRLRFPHGPSVRGPCAGQPPVPGSGQRSCEAGHSLVNCSDGRGG